LTILTDSNIALIPVGNSARLADPVAIWAGEESPVGDGSGGTIGHRFTVPSGLEQRFVFTVDTVTLFTDTATGIGDVLCTITHHHELANQAESNTRVTTLPTRTISTVQAQVSDISRWLKEFPVWWRRDLGGTAGEREIVRMSAGTNVNLTNYFVRAAGRVYDARILASRDFWTLFPSTQPIP